MQNAAVALRILTPRPTLAGDGDGDSLQNVNTAPLPDGALAYVLETNLAYRLHKTLVPPIVGTLAPGSGPGVWVPEAGSALFVNSVQFGAGVPGTVTTNNTGIGSTSASALPTTPLLATDILFGGQLGATVPTGIVTSAQLDLVTFAPAVSVRIQWYNPTGGDIAVPGRIIYYFIVYRPPREVLWAWGCLPVRWSCGVGSARSTGMAATGASWPNAADRV